MKNIFLFLSTAILFSTFAHGKIKEVPNPKYQEKVTEVQDTERLETYEGKNKLYQGSLTFLRPIELQNTTELGQDNKSKKEVQKKIINTIFKFGSIEKEVNCELERTSVPKGVSATKLTTSKLWKYKYDKNTFDLTYEDVTISIYCSVREGVGYRKDLQLQNLTAAEFKSFLKNIGIEIKNVQSSASKNISKTIKIDQIKYVPETQYRK